MVSLPEEEIPITDNDYHDLKRLYKLIYNAGKGQTAVKRKKKLAKRKEKKVSEAPRNGWDSLMIAGSGVATRAYANQVIKILRDSKYEEFIRTLVTEYLKTEKKQASWERWFKGRSFKCCAEPTSMVGKIKKSAAGLGAKISFLGPIEGDARMWSDIVRMYNFVLEGGSDVDKPNDAEIEWYSSILGEDTAHIEYADFGGARGGDIIDSQYDAIGDYSGQIRHPGSSFGYLEEGNIGGFNPGMSYNMDPNSSSIILFVAIFIFFCACCLLWTFIVGLGGIFAAFVFRKNHGDRKDYNTGGDGREDEEVA
eukprot:UN00942